MAGVVKLKPFCRRAISRFLAHPFEFLAMCEDLLNNSTTSGLQPRMFKESPNQSNYCRSSG